MGPSTSDLARPTTTGVSPDRAAAPGPEVVLRRIGACIGRHVNNALTGVIGYLELGLRAGDGQGRFAGSSAGEPGQCVSGRRNGEAPGGLRLAKRACGVSDAGVATPARPGGGARASLAHGNLEVSVTGDPNGWACPTRTSSAPASIKWSRIRWKRLNGEGTLTFAVKEEPGHTLLQLHDSGPGFSAEAAAHLFDPFWTSKPNGHLGLGLVLCRDSLHAQGGQLVVASTPGRRAQVTLSLPAAALDAPPVPMTYRLPRPLLPHQPGPSSTTAA